MRYKLGESRAIAGWHSALSALPRAAFFWAVVACCVLLGGAGASLGQALANESDAPVEQTSVSEDVAICTPHSPKRREALSNQRVSGFTRGGHRCISAVTAVPPVLAGHRLANGLCAPLRC
jgi:hypothetical protein